MSRLKYSKFVIPSLITFGRPDLYRDLFIYGRAFRSKEIEALHNVTFFSKLSRRHFSENITKFSEQLTLRPSSNYIVNEPMSN